MTGYYLIERYPTFDEVPSNTEVAEAYQQAGRLAQIMRRVVVSRTKR